MARDSVTVDFLLETKDAEKDLARIRKEMQRLGTASGKAFKGLGGGAGGGEKIRALGTGLSKATVRADEFTKSLEASNARVVAFGASAGIIMQIDRAFKAMVSSTIKVEKALLDVNVVLNATQKNLKKFGTGMFQISKQTAQGFDTVAEAATELARQGLGMEKTLMRTKDALILTRLTGMDAAESVKSLTAAVNSFNKEGVTSAQVINKMAKVDAAFAVSSEDLAKAISRVGASAVSAGVSMDELLAITTAVQQRTARGGAVIGNAFKTIFTRIQRTDVLQKLRNIGVAVTDMQGNMLSGIQVMQNLANGFDSLSKSQQASVSESVAGVFQVNILKAAMSDLSSQTSNYTRALKVSNSATDEAYRRNEQLNQSLDALINRTLANLTQAGASLGGGALEPAIRRTLGFVNGAIESFGKGGVMEGFGETFGKGIVDGIGKFIAGPGIAGITATIGVLFFKLTKFTGKAFSDIMGINKASSQRQAIESAIVTTMQAEPKLLQQVLNKEVSILSIEQQILATIRKQALERVAMARIAAPVTGSLMSKGVGIGRSGGMRMGRAQGFVPNFANAGAERASASAGGYKAGAIRTMNQPGAGSMMYNSAETVKRFPGMSQSAIMPPRNSLAGSNYKSSFSAAHGFNPYAAAGFIPNFRKAPTRDLAAGKKLSGRKINTISLTGPGGKGAQDIGVLLAEGSTSTGISYKNRMKDIPGLAPALAASPSGAKLLTGELGARLTPDTKFTSYGIPAVSMFPMSMQQAEAHTDGKVATSSLGGLQKALNRYKDQVGAKLFGKYAKGAGNPFNVKSLSKGTEGDIFEEAVRSASKGTSIVRTAAFDFDGTNYAPPALMDFMKNEGANLNLSASKVEAKIGNEAAISGNIPKKIINDLLDGSGANVGYYKSLRTLTSGIRAQAGLKGKTAASGFIPNFSPLASAVGREMSAGVPSSAIRVGSSNSLKSSSNPGGLGVYNTIHEPGGLSQGVSRARASGINPKSHGIPNYALLDDFGRPIDASSGKAGRANRFAGGGRILGKSIDDLVKSTKKSTAATVAGTKATATAAKQSGKLAGFFKGVGGRLSGGGGLGLGLLVPSITGGLRNAGIGNEGGAGGAAMGALENAAMYGGTGMMIHPLLGAAGAIGGAILGGISGFAKKAEDSIDDLSKAMDKLSQRDDRAAETFGRIADELDKVNKAGGDVIAIEKQRNELVAFVKENYGDDSQYAGIFKDIGRASTGKDVREVRQKAADTFLANQAGDRMEKALLGATMTEIKGYKVEGGGSIFNRLNAGTGIRVPMGMSSSRKINRGFYDPNSPEFEQIKDSPFLNLNTAMGGETAFMRQVRNRAGGRNFKAELAARKSLDSLNDVLLGSENRKGGRSFLQEIADMGSGKGTETFRGRTFGINTFDGQKESTAALAQRRQSLRQSIETVDFMTDRTTGKQSLMGVQALADELAGLSGLTGEGKKEASEMLMRRAREAAKETGGTFTAGDALKEMAQDALESGLALSALNKVFKTRDDAENTRIEKIKQEIRLQDKRVTAFRTQIGALDQLSKETIKAAAGLKHTAAMANIQIAFNNRIEGIRGRGTVAGVRATGDPRSVAFAQQTASLGAEKVRFKGANTAANAAFKKSVGDLQLKTLQGGIDSILKDALKGDVGLSPEILKSRTEDVEAIFKAIKGDKLGTISENDIKNFEETLKNLGGLAAGEGGDKSLRLSDIERMSLSNASDILKSYRTLNADFKNGVLQRKQTNENNKKFIEETLKLNNQEIDNRFKFNARLRDFNEAVAASLARQQAAEAGSRMGSGKITGAQGAALYRNAMNTRRTNKGLGNMQQEAGESMMMGFRGEMTYNDRSYLDDLEDGSKSVAASMKSSFADAFKSIASGATDARSAIVQFADGILNTISDVTSRIGTNMLFSGMGFSRGGSVPGYNKGGIVTGGSGYKDDVPAMMNGGEFVIKKSSAQKIGYGALNAINSGGAPGYNAGGMFALSAGASMLSGAINSGGQSTPSATRGQDYGQGRGAYGYFGGADINATGPSSMSGGSQSAAISLSKGFNFYRRDPATGRLISERSRPTEGGFDVSSALSLQGRLNSADPQTARMFGREKSMGDYGNYLNTETARRKEVVRAHEAKKRGRLVSAYANAAMLIGGSYLMNRTGQGPDVVGPNGMSHEAFQGSGGEAYRLKEGFLPVSGGGRMGEAFGRKVPLPPMPPGFQGKAGGGSVGASPAMLTGGEYVMSPDTVRTHGLGFMSELNRGNVPGYAGGGYVGGAGGSGSNVNISVNVDRRGNPSVESSANNEGKENDQQEMQKNKQFGAALQTVVLQEIMKQQRPGGLLQKTN